MTNNDQQRLYDNTTMVLEWISSLVPNRIAIRAIASILMESIHIAGKSLERGKRLHVPRLLLSASAEFQAAYGQEPSIKPDLSRISVDDARVRDSPWFSEEGSTPPRKAKTELKLKIPPSRTSAAEGSSASARELDVDVDKWLNNLNEQLSDMSVELELIKLLLEDSKGGGKETSD